MKRVEEPRTRPLERDLEADVCVIGAGMAGLSTAYALMDTGRTVVVLEDGAIGSGESSRTTAHLATAFDDRYTLVEHSMDVMERG
jgi:glycine/D-amino acid oxidase-like deaminating enzyme